MNLIGSRTSREVDLIPKMGLRILRGKEGRVINRRGPTSEEVCRILKKNIRNDLLTLVFVDGQPGSGKRNGCESKEELRRKITLYLEKNSKQNLKEEGDDYKIGCIVLSNCEFWENGEYLNIEDFNLSFPKEVVKLKYFDEDDLIKNSLSLPEKKDFELVSAVRERFENVTTTKRDGQARFKRRMLEIYSNKCCISGEEIPELLDAAHIQPYINNSSNHIQNGLLLRKDLHTLFDNGLLSISQNYTISLSPLIKSKYYLDFKEKSLSLPANNRDYPSKQALKLREDMFRI